MGNFNKNESTTLQEQIDDKLQEIKENESQLIVARKDVSNSFRIYLHAITICICGLHYGIALAQFSTLLGLFIPRYKRMGSFDPENPTVKAAIDYARNRASSAFLCGCTLACALGAVIVRMFGTRNVAYINLIVFISANVYIAFDIPIKRMLAFFIMRFLVGFSVYLWTTVGPLYMKETVPAHVYSRVISAFNFNIGIGLALGYLFGRESIADNWQYLFVGLALAEGIRFLVLMITPVNDPAWLLAKGANEEAIKGCFIRFYNEQRAGEIAKLMTEKRVLENKLSELKVKAGKSDSGFFDFLSSDYNLQFAVALTLSFLNQLTGMNLLTIFASDIFHAGGMLKEAADYWSTVMTICCSLGALVPIPGIPLIGKRALMIWGLWGQGLGLAIFIAALAFKQTFMVFIGASVAMFFYNISTGGILFGYIPEFVPKNGIFVAALLQLSLGAAFAYNYKTMENILTLEGLFFIAQLFSIGGALMYTAVGVNTTGKSPTAIKEEFLAIKRKLLPFSK